MYRQTHYLVYHSDSVATKIWPYIQQSPTLLGEQCVGKQWVHWVVILYSLKSIFRIWTNECLFWLTLKLWTELKVILTDLKVIYNCLVWYDVQWYDRDNEYNCIFSETIDKPTLGFFLCMYSQSVSFYWISVNSDNCSFNTMDFLH